MLRIPLWLLLLAATPVLAQSAKLPKGLSVRLDTFTGDTIYETDYGRLDEAKGCSRSSLAITFKAARGTRGRAEFLVYDYIEVDGPFSRSKWIGGQSVFLNIDGDIFEVKPTVTPTRFNADRTTKKESAAFRLPDSTLARIARATDARLRIIGTDKTCDGIIERNLQVRLLALFAYLKPRP